MELILIRHAQSIGNEKDIVQGHIDEGLSELGKVQAKQLANYFNADSINAIYSSDLSRAIHTAKPIADKLNLVIKIDPNLREANFGHSEGMTYKEVQEKFPEEYNRWNNNFFNRPAWFESFESHFQRVKAALEKILKDQNLNYRVAVFTHGGSIKTQLSYFNKLSGEEIAKLRTLNCSLTTIKFNPTKNYRDGKLICYNEEVIKNSTKRDF